MSDPLRVEALILQISAVGDCGPQERAAIADGVLPLVVFANGPSMAFLIKTNEDELNQALRAALHRKEHRAEERDAFRGMLFGAIAAAIENNFAAPDSEADFSTDALMLFAESLVQHGLREAAHVAPCATLFQRGALDAPEYERAPLDG